VAVPVISILLGCVIACAWVVALRGYGPFSFVSAGVFCFTAYSIPALLGLVFPFHDVGYVGLVRSSTLAVAVTALAWIAFLLALSVSVPGWRRAFSVSAPDVHLPSFVGIALIYCIAGFVVIAAMDGPLFFLAQREEQSESLVRLLWRWVNAVGLVSAVLTRSWRAAAVFLAALGVYFVAGDRTVLVITSFCLIVGLFQGRSLRDFLRWRVVIGTSVAALLALFGKPVYLAIKAGSWDRLFVLGDSAWLEVALTTFEPFITFNILDLVVVHGFMISAWDMIAGCLAQLLLVPSAFGIASNSFNADFTATFVPQLSYGIAGNYWAQGWAVAGPVGVVLYGLIFAVSLRVLDVWSRKYCGAMRVLCVLLGALIAVYVHRNSLDNLLSFVRQIVLVVAAIAAPSAVLARFIWKPQGATDISKSAGIARTE
jgi:hypothetical protein